MEHKQPLEDPEVQAAKKRRSGFSDGPIEGETVGDEALHAPAPTEHENAPAPHAHEAPDAQISLAHRPEAGHSAENIVVKVPQKEVPYVNFAELLRSESATLRAIESDTGCQIILKGSEFEKQIAGAGVEMHLLVTGPDPSSVASANVKLESFLADERVRFKYMINTFMEKINAAPVAAAPLEAEREIWYYVDRRVNQQQGPVTISRMRQLYQTGEIDDDSYIWNDSFDGWKYIRELPALKKDLQSPSATSGFPSSGNVSSIVNIPNKLVGLFIGKQGAHIKDFEIRHATKIQPQKESDMFPGSQDREVTITGTHENIERTKQSIAAWVADVSSDKSGAGGAGGAPGGAAINVSRTGPIPGSEVMLVPNSVVGYLIGKAGCKIIELQNKSGARIQAGKDSEHDPATGMRPIYIAGEHINIQYAKHFINETVAEANQKSLGTGPSGSFAPPGTTPNVSTEEFMVAGNSIGIVIGKSGSKIHELMATTGAKIHLVTNYTSPTGSADRPFSISGTPEQREYAKKLIQDLIDEKNAMYPPPPRLTRLCPPEVPKARCARHAGK